MLSHMTRVEPISSSEAERSLAGRFRRLIEQIGRLEAQRSMLSSDIDGLYESAKMAGFDVGTVKRFLRLARTGAPGEMADDRLLQLYKEAIGIECHQSWF